MTRPLQEVEEVISLRQQGLGARRIGRHTGIPVKTVQEWLSDPERALSQPRRAGFRDCTGQCSRWAGLDNRAYSYLFGQYLGDGHIVRVGRTYRLSIYGDQKYTGIIGEVEESIRLVLPELRVSRTQRDGCIAVSSYSKHWPCLFPQHGPGMKHERRIVLSDWQRKIVGAKPRPFLRGLIHSDGWRGDNVAIRHTQLATEYHTYSRYLFSNRSEDIRRLFCWACDLVGVHWTQSNRWHISVARRKDVHYLDSFIGPKR